MMFVTYDQELELVGFVHIWILCSQTRQQQTMAGDKYWKSVPKKLTSGCRRSVIWVGMLPCFE